MEQCRRAGFLSVKGTGSWQGGERYERAQSRGAAPERSSGESVAARAGVA
jgi:hypothetical protein